MRKILLSLVLLALLALPTEASRISKILLTEDMVGRPEIFMYLEADAPGTYQLQMSPGIGEGVSDWVSILEWTTHEPLQSRPVTVSPASSSTMYFRIIKVN